MLEPRKSKAKATTKKGPKLKNKKKVQNGIHRTQICNCKMCCCFETGDDTWSKTQTHKTTESAVCGNFGSLEYYVRARNGFCPLLTQFLYHLFSFTPATAANLLFDICFAHFYYRLFQFFDPHTHTHSKKMPATYAATRFAFDCNHC